MRIMTQEMEKRLLDFAARAVQTPSFSDEEGPMAALVLWSQRQNNKPSLTHKQTNCRNKHLVREICSMPRHTKRSKHAARSHWLAPSSPPNTPPGRSAGLCLLCSSERHASAQGQPRHAALSTPSGSQGKQRRRTPQLQQKTNQQKEKINASAPKTLTGRGERIFVSSFVCCSSPHILLLPLFLSFLFSLTAHGRRARQTARRCASLMRAAPPRACLPRRSVLRPREAVPARQQPSPTPAAAAQARRQAARH